MKPITFEAKITQQDISIEDGGSAVIVEPTWNVQNGDENIFVRIQSFDESVFKNRQVSKEKTAKMGHQAIHQLVGKKIRVTIEEIDE